MSNTRLLRWSGTKFASLLEADGRPKGAIAAKIAVAANTATSANDLTNWANGTRPSVDTMFAIAHVLGCTVEDLAEPVGG